MKYPTWRLISNRVCKFDSLVQIVFVLIVVVADIISYTFYNSSMRSQYRIPNYGLTLIILSIITIFTLSMTKLKPYLVSLLRAKVMQGIRKSVAERFSSIKRHIGGQSGIHHIVENQDYQEYFSSQTFWTQLKLLTVSQYKAYRPGCVNIWRIFEVSTLALLVGLLFYDVGNKQSGGSLGQKSGFLFFSVTLWTFTRMYPAVGSNSVWHKLAVDFSTAFEKKDVKM